MKREFIKMRKEIQVKSMAKSAKPNSKVKMIIISAFIHVIVILTFMLSVVPSESKKSVDTIVTIELMEPQVETSLIGQKIDDGFASMINDTSAANGADEVVKSDPAAKMNQANNINQNDKVALTKEEQIMLEKVVEFWQKYFLKIFEWR